MPASKLLPDLYTQFALPWVAFLGNLADRVGQKSVLMVETMILLIGSIVITGAPNIKVVLAAQVFQPEFARVLGIL